MKESYYYFDVQTSLTQIEVSVQNVPYSPQPTVCKQERQSDLDDFKCNTSHYEYIKFIPICLSIR
jgi:CRISPR/Cas system endoribonuclease Cas6 (RAMP superfamily)